VFAPKQWQFYDPVPGDEPWACIRQDDLKDLAQELNNCRSRR
jgi:hypothetical protein